MFKKLSLNMLRPKKEDSLSAQERGRAASMPRPSSPLDFSDGDLPDSYGSISKDALRLDALNLETITAPFLRQMRPLMAPREVLMGQAPKRAGQSLADRARAEIYRRPSIAVEMALQNSDIGLLTESVPVTTPGDERDNPFDDPELNAMIITPIPRRPDYKRRPVSARGRRDMPLRVQAMRRSHQNAFVEAIRLRIEEEAAQQSRRASLEEGETISFVPSGLYERRTKRSPESEEPPPMRINLHPEDPHRLFRQRDLLGQEHIYRMDRPMTDSERMIANPSIDPKETAERPLTPVQLFVREDGRSFF